MDGYECGNVTSRFILADFSATLRFAETLERPLRLRGLRCQRSPVATAIGKHIPSVLMGEVGELGSDAFNFDDAFESVGWSFEAPVVRHVRIGVRHCFRVRPSTLISGTVKALASSMIGSFDRNAATSGSPHRVYRS